MNRISRYLFSFSAILLMAVMFSACDDSGLVTPPSTAGRFTMTFGGSASDVLSSMKQTTDGGFILGGYTISSGAGGNDFYLVKTDNNGTLSWSKTYGGNMDDECTSVCQTTDGGYVAAGITNSFGADGVDAMIVKTDASGNVQWSKVYKIVNDQFISSIIQDSDGDYVICGYTNQNAASNNDVFVMKVTPAGVYQWEYVYGEMLNDYAAKIIKTSDGGFLTAGLTFNFGAALGDVYLIKMKPDGTLDWSKTYGGAGMDAATDVIENAGHDFMVIGSTSSFGLNDGDMLVFKTDHSGFVYNDTVTGMPRTIGNTLGPDVGTSVTAASDGSYFITGYLSTSAATTDIFIAHYFGNMVYDYSKTYGAGTGTDKGISIISNGTGLSIGGVVNSFGAGGGNNDFLLMSMKADSTGRFASCMDDNLIAPNGGSPSLTVANVNTTPYPLIVPVEIAVAVTTGGPSTATYVRCTQ